MKISIQIKNYEKFNPRSDSKRPSWFRFENNFFFSQSMFDLSKDERLVWIFLLCYASGKNSGDIIINPLYVSQNTDVDLSCVTKTIDKLEERQCLTITRTDNKSNILCAHATNERTNELIAQNEFEPQEHRDLESLYKQYPRKVGKTRGMKILHSQIKNIKDYQDIELAIKNLVQFVKHEKREKEMIPYFSTFMSQWRDWVNPDPSILGNKTNGKLDFGKSIAND